MIRTYTCSVKSCSRDINVDIKPETEQKQLYNLGTSDIICLGCARKIYGYTSTPSNRKYVTLKQIKLFQKKNQALVSQAGLDNFM